SHWLRRSNRPCVGSGDRRGAGSAPASQPAHQGGLLPPQRRSSLGPAGGWGRDHLGPDPGRAVDGRTPHPGPGLCWSRRVTGSAVRNHEPDTAPTQLDPSAAPSYNQPRGPDTPRIEDRGSPERDFRDPRSSFSLNLLRTQPWRDIVMRMTTTGRKSPATT